MVRTRTESLVTSQSDAAPKPKGDKGDAGTGLVTSQSDAAPKHQFKVAYVIVCLVTSQSDAAPKRDRALHRRTDV